MSHYGQFDQNEFEQSEVTTLSPFTSEKTPSCTFFKKNGIYSFKDFSSGKGGDAIEFVKELYSEDFRNASKRIIKDYNTFIMNGGVVHLSDFKEKSRYSVESFNARAWTSKDQYFWTRFNIGSKLLNLYNVVPLSSYCLKNDENTICINGEYIYAFLRNDGQIYKIYQPYNAKYKFLKFHNYIQGEEQVEGHPFLLYTKALKDIMSIRSFKFRIDLKAPDSENTLIPKHIVQKDLKTYKKVLVLFDNDEAGIKASQKYKELYGITPVYLNYGEKDVSDHIKKFGATKTYYWLAALLNKKLNE